VVNKWTAEEIAIRLALTGEESVSMRKEAEKICESVYSKDVFIRGIIEFSNICRKDCMYCGIRKSNKNTGRYRIEKEQIKKLLDDAYLEGYKTVVLQSGEDTAVDRDITKIIEYTKSKNDMSVTLSLGERSFEVYEEWRKAGADRYLLRIETTNKNIFTEIHPDDDFENRLRCLNDLKRLGYEAGTGIMIGLPGQTEMDLAKDIIFFKENDFDMLGFGPFIPHRDTPLKDVKAVSMEKVLNFLALCRIVTVDTNIPATTAMGTLDPKGRQMALMSGANVIMPNFTPRALRKNYLLYDNKIGVDDDAEESLEHVNEIVREAGKRVADVKGDRIKSC